MTCPAMSGCCSSRASRPAGFTAPGSIARCSPRAAPETYRKSRSFRGGLTRQVRNCLQYLHGRSPVHLRKEPERIETRRWRAYPAVALRETLVNALYHRSYEPDVLGPTKVYLYPDRVEIISYPGPVPGLEPQHFLLRSSFPTGARPQPPHRRVSQGARTRRGAPDRVAEGGRRDGRATALRRRATTSTSNAPTFALRCRRTRNTPPFPRYGTRRSCAPWETRTLRTA